MDPLTHVLVTYAAIGRERALLIASLAPDIPFYATYPLWVVRRGVLRRALTGNEWPDAPSWMYAPHHMTHSLPLIGAIALALRLRSGRWPRWCLAWIVHILIDIPTHSRKHWAPQFLWPFSACTVDGVSWPILLGRLFQRRRAGSTHPARLND